MDRMIGYPIKRAASMPAQGSPGRSNHVSILHHPTPTNGKTPREEALWAAVRGPGPLPAGRVFVGHFVIGWGLFNMLEGVARHNLRDEWLIFATGMGFVLLGVMLIWTRAEPLIERRSGYDRRSGSPVR